MSLISQVSDLGPSWPSCFLFVYISLGDILGRYLSIYVMLNHVIPVIDILWYIFRVYGFMVMFFFVVQVINNYAFIFKIPMTLHIIFRAVSMNNIARVGAKTVVSKTVEIWLIYFCFTLKSHYERNWESKIVLMKQ
jgi:hypothetical protein